MKHAVLLQALERLKETRPLSVLDTHAGAGVYDLADELSMRSGEARTGVKRLMGGHDAPAAFAPLKAAIQACNPGDGLRWYPGSPRLITQSLRPGDRYVGCELRADDVSALRTELRRAQASTSVDSRAVRADGYAQARSFLEAERGGLIFVDPPFEAADDYDRIVELVGRVGNVSAMIWTPLKDLETFDRLLRRLEATNVAKATVVELRLRPLVDPMRMNGCALLLIGVPNIQVDALAICSWVASEAGDAGASASLYEL